MTTAWRWPWIARTTHLALIEARDRLITYERDRREAAETERALIAARHADLLERYIALLSPAPVLTVASVPSAPNVSRSTRERSVVERTIRDQAAGDPKLAAHFRKRARELKLEGLSDERIAVELAAWATTEPDEASG